MKNIIKFYKEHRIFTILMAIVIVCLVLIATVLVQCFYVGNGSDKYGNRLEGIDKVKITSSRQKDFENNTSNNEKVKSVDIIVEGRIIYIKMVFEPNVKLVEAESIALKTLETFSDEEKAFYDFNYTLTQNSTDNSDGFHISGARNKNGTGKIVWNNNAKKSIKPVDDSATEKED